MEALKQLIASYSETGNSNENINALSINYKVIIANQNVKYELPGLKVLFQEPYQLGNINQSVASSIFKSNGNFVEMLLYGYRWLDATVGGFSSPLRGTYKIFKSVYYKTNQHYKIDFLIECINQNFKGLPLSEWMKGLSELRTEILKLIFNMSQVMDILKQFNKSILKVPENTNFDFKEFINGLTINH